MTDLDEKQIILKVISKLDNGDITVIDSLDNSEIREEKMISVGITETTQVNFGLPDYQSEMSIFVSTHIDEDDTGEDFDDLVKYVFDILNVYILDQSKLPEMFDEIPVVGFIYKNMKKMTVNDEYGKCYLAQLDYTIITSY